MVQKRILRPERVRRISGGFSFIPHRFLNEGFISLLSPAELLLYFFLVLASDSNGLSYYSERTICALLHMRPDTLSQARRSLIEKDMVAFDGTLFQVLELPVIVK
jgi:hypothetical protein